MKPQYNIFMVRLIFLPTVHPDFIGILPILLENPESRPICDQGGKKNLYFDISKWTLMILIQEHITDYT